MTVDPDVNFAFSETCTVTVVAANVADQDTNDPPDLMAADHVATFHDGGGAAGSGARRPVDVAGQWRR